MNWTGGKWDSFTMSNCFINKSIKGNSSVIYCALFANWFVAHWLNINQNNHDDKNTTAQTALLFSVTLPGQNQVINLGKNYGKK